MEKKYKWLLAGITGTAGLFFGSRMLVHQLVKGIGTIFTTDPYQENIAEALFSRIPRWGAKHLGN